MAKLQIQIEQVRKTVYAILVGSIDEDADFERIPTQGIISFNFDMNGIEAINSCGIREWIQLLDRMDTHAKVVYRNCPSCIVDQFNIAADLTMRNATIESFYAPYYCGFCDKESSQLLTMEDVIETKDLPSRLCDCGRTLQADVPKEGYLSFMSLFTGSPG